jgi:hypothetical protein
MCPIDPGHAVTTGDREIPPLDDHEIVLYQSARLVPWRKLL